MKVLVTGATGMVGAELTRQLLDEGVDVRIFRRESSGLELLGDAAAAVEHAVGDVTDQESIDMAMKGVGHVYHTAAFIGFSGRKDEKMLHAVNVRGTGKVVDAAARSGVERLVHVSSMAAFGRPERPQGLIDEDSTWQSSRQNSRYAYSKYLSELEVYRGVAEGLDAVIVNPALIFGRARPGENTREIIDKVRSEKLPGVPDGGTNVVDSRDVARGMRLAMLNGKTGERYFLGSENLWWRQIFEIIAEAVGSEPPTRRIPPRLAMAVAYASEAMAAVTRTRPVITRETVRTSNRFYRYSNEKAKQELGCTFRPFSETARFAAQASEA